MAHFFSGTHEQSYIAHVIGYAACLGVYRSQPHCTSTSTTTPVHHSHHYHHRDRPNDLDSEWNDENDIFTNEVPSDGKPRGSLATSRRRFRREANTKSAAFGLKPFGIFHVTIVTVSMSWTLFLLYTS